MEALEQGQHRAVLVVEQSTRDPDLVGGRDPHEVLVERAVVDRAHAEAVRHERLPGQRPVRLDVRGVEEADLPEAADCALVAMCEEHRAAKASLVEPDLRLADDVPPLERVLDRNRRGLVDRADELAGRDENASLDGRSCIT